MDLFNYLSSCFGHSEAATSNQDDGGFELSCREAAAVSQEANLAQPKILRDSAGNDYAQPKVQSNRRIASRDNDGQYTCDNCNEKESDSDLLSWHQQMCKGMIGATKGVSQYRNDTVISTDERLLSNQADSTLAHLWPVLAASNNILVNRERDYAMRTGFISPMPRESAHIYTVTTLSLSDMHAFTTLPAKPSRRIVRSLFQCTISIVWVSSISKKDGIFIMQEVLTHERSDTVRFLQNVLVSKQVRTILCRSGYGEELKKWSKSSFVAAHFGKFDSQIVPEEADRQGLLDGKELSLGLCTTFIRDRADAARSPSMTRSRSHRSDCTHKEY